MPSISTLLGLFQLATAVAAGLAGLGIIHPSPDLSAWLVAAAAGAGGAHKVGNGSLK